MPDVSEKTMTRSAMATSPYRNSSQQLVSLKRSERVFLRLIFHCMVLNTFDIQNIFVVGCKCGTGLIETKCERIGRFVVGRVVLER